MFDGVRFLNLPLRLRAVEVRQVHILSRKLGSIPTGASKPCPLDCGPMPSKHSEQSSILWQGFAFVTGRRLFPPKEKYSGSTPDKGLRAEWSSSSSLGS